MRSALRGSQDLEEEMIYELRTGQDKQTATSTELFIRKHYTDSRCFHSAATGLELKPQHKPDSNIVMLDRNSL